MDASDTNPQELAKLEYQTALTAYSQATHLRRQDMALVTTVQGAVLTIAGDKLLHLDARASLLSVIAVFSLLMGLNNERRLTLYMNGYMQRAQDIEGKLGMCVTLSAHERVSNARGLFSNSLVFPLYYIVFLVVWVSIWALNLF